MIKIMLVAIVIAFSGSVVAQGKEIRGSRLSFQNWQGAAYTNDITGQFSHCVVSASFLSGDTLFFSVTREGSFAVAVSSSNLDLEVGEQFEVAMYVDRRKPFFGTATAISENFANLLIPDLRNALDAFRRGRLLVIRSRGLEGRYDLTGTFRALEQVTKCASDLLHYAEAPSSKPSSPTGIELNFLYQIATKTLTSLGIAEYKFADSSEINQLGLGSETVRWSSEQYGITGTVTAVRHVAGNDIQSTDIEDIKFVTSQCSAEFASSTKDLSENGQQLREIRVLCLNPDQEIEHYITKFLVDGVVFYTWFIFEGGKTPPNGGSAQSEASKAAISAAKFVVD